LSSRNPRAKAAGIVAVAIPVAALLGYASDGLNGALGCLGVTAVLVLISLAVVVHGSRQRG
jgi:hypothetical protein